MAVAVDATGTVLTDVTGTTNPVDFTGLTVGAALSNSAQLILIQLQGDGTISSVVWDQGGTNQSATLISHFNASSGAISTAGLYMYGLIAPTAGNKTLRITLSAAVGTVIVDALSFTGVNQTSVAAAFTNVSTANAADNVSHPSIAVTSAVGNLVVAQARLHDNDNNSNGTLTPNNTSVFTVNSASFVGTAAASANRAAGAASVTMSNTVGGTAAGTFVDTWAMQGVNIVAAGAAVTVAPLLDTQNLIVRRRKIVSDNLTAPPQAATATVATPSVFGYQTVDRTVKRNIRYLPEPLAFAPRAYVPTPSVFGYQTVDRTVKRKIRYLPEPFVFPPIPVVYAASAVSGAVDENTSILSRMVYDQTTGAVFTPAPVPTPSAFGYQSVDGGIKRKIRYLPEPFAFAPVAYTSILVPVDFGYSAVTRKIRYLPEALVSVPVTSATVPTPADFGYQTVDGGTKRRIRYLPEPFAFAPVAYTLVPTPSDFGYQTDVGGIKRKIRYLPESFALVPVTVVTVPTPSDFGYQTEGGQRRRLIRPIPEVFSSFVFAGIPIVPTATQKDGDPDYWKLPWFNVEGGSFAESLRTKAITALEEAEDLAQQAEPAKAKRAVRKAAKGLQEYVRATGALLSDDMITELGQIAKHLNYLASQWDRSELIERVSHAHMALLAYEAALQDEEDALIALMVQ